MSNNFDDDPGFGRESLGDDSLGGDIAFTAWGPATASGNSVPYQQGEASADGNGAAGTRSSSDAGSIDGGAPPPVSFDTIDAPSFAKMSSTSAASQPAHESPAAEAASSAPFAAAVAVPPDYFEPGSFRLSNANQAWSYQTDGDTMRFELRSGDVAPGDIEEGDGRERTEIVSLKQFYDERNYTIHFDYMIEPGAKNTSNVLVLGQLLQSMDPLDTPTSPPFFIGMRGEKLQVAVRYTTDPITPLNPTEYRFIDTEDIVRGRWYDIKVDIRFDPYGNGFMKLYRDGVLLVDYAGGIGYVDEFGPHWKNGLYREQSPETIVANFRDVQIVGEGAPPPIDGTAGNDDLFGGWENEHLSGLAGNDFLDGGVYADVMNGGAGNDSYVVDNVGDIVNEVENRKDAGGIDEVSASVTFVLGSYLENLSLTGFAAIDGTGNALTNEIRGNTAANTMNGLNGDDFLSAGAGLDKVYGGAGADKIFGGDGNDSLFGEADNDVVNGDDGDDVMDGGSGDDVMRGGAGADSMTGGLGNDTYYVDNARDVVIEAVRGGTDTVYASVGYSIASRPEVENLRADGAAAVNLTGNALANTIIGNAAANAIAAGGGDDKISGGAGNDTLSGDDGADILSGDAGVDAMSGGAGNDIYYVDNIFDTVNEVAGGGSDTIYTSVNFFLKPASEVEFMRTISATATTRISMIGSDFANTMYGNAGTNIMTGGGGDDRINGDAKMDLLSGGEGNDVLNGGLGNDNMMGGAGNDIYYVDDSRDIVTEAAGGGSDTVYASSNCNLGAAMEVEVMRTTAPAATTSINMIGSNTANTIYGNAGANVLSGAGGDDRLNGDAGNDLLSGGDGNDTMNGGLGVDNMIGGLGNDIYNVDNARDIATEAARGGSDTVNTSVSYVLGAASEIEILKTVDVTATTAINLTGNGIVNTIRGNAGANIINGGGGIDQLTGYEGNDVFVFSSVAEAGDRINDFGLGNDTLYLDNAGFGRGVGVGTLAEAGVDFVFGIRATTANESLIYNTANGQLFWDEDGTGGGAATLIAFLSNRAALTAADFHFI